MRNHASWITPKEQTQITCIINENAETGAPRFDVIAAVYYHINIASHQSFIHYALGDAQ